MLNHTQQPEAAGLLHIGMVGLGQAAGQLVQEPVQIRPTRPGGRIGQQRREVRLRHGPEVPGSGRQRPENAADEGVADGEMELKVLDLRGQFDAFLQQKPPAWHTNKLKTEELLQL